MWISYVLKYSRFTAISSGTHELMWLHILSPPCPSWLWWDQKLLWDSFVEVSSHFSTGFWQADRFSCLSLPHRSGMVMLALKISRTGDANTNGYFTLAICAVRCWVWVSQCRNGLWWWPIVFGPQQCMGGRWHALCHSAPGQALGLLSHIFLL